MKSRKIYFITIVSILSTLSTIIFLIGGFPIFLAFPYLKIDLSDIPALIGGIVVSPGAGLLIELIKNSFHILKTHTMGIGELLSLIVGSTIVISFCFPFRWSIKKNNFKISILISYLTCLFFTLIVALISNNIIYPLFLSSGLLVTATENIINLYLISVLIINFIKVTIVVLISILIIKVLKII
ncbi:MAG: ECF transporter S component [Oscillospiraceae bacterium]|nr:ECF transporter S component [Oscillospiraceae bacterium]